MKKYVNGKYIEMTEEEIEEMKAKMPEIPERIQESVEERLKKVEKALTDDSAQRNRIESMLETIYAKLGLG